MKRVGLILSGGLSLGSFEAGIIYEFLSALHQFPNNPPFVVDFFAGSSAGGILSIMAGFHLSHQFTSPHLKCLHDIWIKDIDYTKLFSSSPEPSLFSQRYLREIAEKYFQISESRPFPHSGCFALVTVTNLDGILSGTRSLQNDTWVIQKVYKDWFFIDFSGIRVQDTPFLTSLALATSAFPLAFAPLELQRSACDYENVPGGFYRQACQQNSPPLLFFFRWRNH